MCNMLAKTDSVYVPSLITNLNTKKKSLFYAYGFLVEKRSNGKHANVSKNCSKQTSAVIYLYVL